MTNLSRRVVRLLAVALAVASATLAGAQEPSEATLGEAAPIYRAVGATTPKYLALIFDVSGSMKKAGYMKRARKAAIAVLREVAQPGDRVALFTFGAGDKKVFDQILRSKADARELVDKIPFDVAPGAGTNIRHPHHEALKALDDPKVATPVVVLLTDSYNDQPQESDPAYAEYVKYYIPGARLDRYPKTPENADYARLLKRFKEKGGQAFGIGIEVDPETGRPIERNPTEAPLAAPATPEPTPQPQRTPTAESPSPLPMVLGGLLAIAALGGTGLFLAGGKPQPLRIVIGTGAPRDFSLKPGQTLRLGGGTGASLDAVPLAGAKDAVAQVRGERGGFSLVPQPNAGARVFHNGLPLESPGPLRYGDEVRVTLSDLSGAGLSKDVRLKFSDPSKEI